MRYLIIYIQHLSTRSKERTEAIGLQNRIPRILEIASASLLFAGIAMLTKTCGPLGVSWRLSYELWNAPCAPTVTERVDLWLIARRPLFIAAERRFHVDRRAIAGVIAYEALDDIHPSSLFGLTRSDGPGKVHYKEGYLTEGLPAAKQVELMGLLPRQTLSTRKRLLSSDEGAITYIAAIMSALAKEASDHGYDLRCNPKILATLYAGWAPISASQLFDVRRYPDPLRLNASGSWVAGHLGTLDNDVGAPEPRVCRRG